MSFKDISSGEAITRCSGNSGLISSDWSGEAASTGFGEAASTGEDDS